MPKVHFFTEMITPCISKRWIVQKSIKHSLLSLQDYRSCELQDSVSRTSLQIGTQNFIDIKSDLLATKSWKKSFSSKFEIWGFMVPVTIYSITFQLFVHSGIYVLKRSSYILITLVNYSLMCIYIIVKMLLRTLCTGKLQTVVKC